MRTICTVAASVLALLAIASIGVAATAPMPEVNDVGVEQEFLVDGGSEALTPPAFGRERAVIGPWSVASGIASNGAGGANAERIIYRTTAAHSGSPAEADDQAMDAGSDWVTQLKFSYTGGGPYLLQGWEGSGFELQLFGPASTGVASTFSFNHRNVATGLATLTIDPDTATVLTLHYKAADQTIDLWQDDTLQLDGYALGLASGVSQMALGGGSSYDGSILIDSFVVGDLIPEPASALLLGLGSMMVVARRRRSA